MNTMSYNADLDCGSTYRFCVSPAYWFGAFTKQAVESFGFVGTVAVEKRLEGATGQTAKSLAELTISSEEVVKTSIQDTNTNRKNL